MYQIRLTFNQLYRIQFKKTRISSTFSPVYSENSKMVTNWCFALPYIRLIVSNSLSY